jgi:hypothetical protein
VNDNVITREGDVTHVEIKPGIVAKFDTADYDAIFAGRPLCLSLGYAVRAKLRDEVGPHLKYSHREIMDPPPGMVVDHANRDKLDNRRANLRVCTQSQNLYNSAKSPGGSSRYKGVSIVGRTGRWLAQIRIAGKQTHLGRFTNEADAAHAYDDAAKATFGEFALLNNLKS